MFHFYRGVVKVTMVTCLSGVNMLEANVNDHPRWWERGNIEVWRLMVETLLITCMSTFLAEVIYTCNSTFQVVVLKCLNQSAFSHGV